jgi:hypothetical protein
MANSNDLTAMVIPTPIPQNILGGWPYSWGYLYLFFSSSSFGNFLKPLDVALPLEAEIVDV